ncbi:MAG: DivIVA domain-containing protein [Desulfofustis sp.]|jgi:DivIVA domain-containing protein|nr:DivIVA domain-containing protein [Desulfofustis sp.]
MAITPQAIKDQEFQTRFRGYDAVEVKAYLELIAEEFFELLERLRQQEEEIAEIKRQKELAEEVNSRLQSDVDASQRLVEELRGSLAEKETREAERAKEIEEMQTALDDFEAERKEFEEELSEAEARVSDRDELLRESRAEMDNLRNKIAFLDEQNRELKKEEVDFKRTIGVAQRFADDLMEKTKAETEELVRQSEQRAQQTLASSEEKAATALQAARDEIERLRREAYAELSRLPEEIEQLSRQRNRVRDELRSILTGHLEQLESFTVDDEAVARYDYDELFQKIEFPEPDELFQPEDPSGSDEVAELNESDLSDGPAESLADEIQPADELDSIHMELPISEELFNQDDDDLRRKLEEGGVAYLSDDD